MKAKRRIGDPALKERPVAKIDLKPVDERVRQVIHECLKAEVELLELDSNERSITHKIAEYLQAEFRKDGYHVDCEYNREGHDPKRLNLDAKPIQSDDPEGETVFPDIIIHERGTNRNNLVVIEAKKSTNEDGETDLRKLRAFNQQLGYKLCYRLIVRVGRNLSEENLYKLRKLRKKPQREKYYYKP